MTPRRRIAVVAPEPIRAKMAGMGIRAFELAKALGPELEVTLLVPNSPSECPPAPGVDVLHAPPGTQRFDQLAAEADAALVSGHAASAFFTAAPEVPVAVDWYDPFLVENFQYAETLGAAVEANDRRAWSLALARGDLFLCASEAQRLFYAGMLVQAGRLDARLVRQDPGLSSLLAVVPFGASDPGPGDPSEVLRILGAAPGDSILYFGGLYDWHDPSAILEAWPELLRRFPGVKLVFAENPNRETTPQKVYEGAADLASRRGWRGRSVFFLPWTPYERRADLYAAATLALCCCRPGLETELSFRTRLLDAAAAGLPSVTLEGGDLARRLEVSGAGSSAQDAGELVEKIAAYLENPVARSEVSSRARRFAAAYSWKEVAAPLAAFLRRGTVSRRLAFPEEGGRAPFRLFGRGRR